MFRHEAGKAVRMPPPEPTTQPTATVLTTRPRPLREAFATATMILLTASLCLHAIYHHTRDAFVAQVREAMTQQAQSVAALVNGDLHRTFTRPEQEWTAEYEQAVDPLRRILDRVPELRFIYTCVLKDGQVHFVLDATPWGDADDDGVEDHSQIMDAYEDADPAMLVALREGRPVATAEPYTDAWGTLMSAYAPFFDSAGRQVGVAAVDITATEYESRLASMRRAAWWGATPGLLMSVLAACGVFRVRRSALRRALDERKWTKAVQESEEKFRIAAECATDLIWMWGFEDSSLEWNGRIDEMLGYAAGEFPRTLAAWEAIIHPEDHDRVMASLDRHLKEHTPYDEQYRVRHRDNTWRVWTDRGIAQFDSQGRPLRMVGVCTDVTDRKQAEERLRAQAKALKAANIELEAQWGQLQSQQEELVRTNRELELARASAEAANHTKSEFLANMSHEIRTPITAILGFADLLEEDFTWCPTCPHGERRAERTGLKGHVETIRRNGQHLLTVINDILDLSKIEAGRLTVECVPVPILSLVEDLISLLRVRAVHKGLTLDAHYEYPLPAAIQSDPVRLRQVLLNLIGNAIKFTERGRVDIAVCFIPRATAGPLMQFDVTDTGIGLSEEQIGRLFRPFTQADTSTTRQFGGTGLGLTISKRLAGMLGGDIEVVRTTPGEGSCFRVTVAAGSLQDVPMIEQPQDASSASATSPGAARAESRAPTDGTRLTGRVLVAEDGEDNRRLLSFVLGKAGLEVTLAVNGRFACEEALAAVAAGRPFDVILMDMQMPEVDGYQATARLRAEGYRHPIIALTAHAMSADRDRCLSAGCDDYATKPIDRADLLALLRRHIQSAPATAGVAQPAS
ncbi:MAG TPA: ATP-binding protein [Phycisphaerae bacterium]|nr:ATP-binding protein [Phycisphaerae bacterium]HNU45363.1 ATP-binding protein [Phycisphaerae bacterium]